MNLERQTRTWKNQEHQQNKTIHLEKDRNKNVDNTDQNGYHSWRQSTKKNEIVITKTGLVVINNIKVLKDGRTAYSKLPNL